MQKALRTVTLGIDYLKYFRFKSCVPSVIVTMNGKSHFHEKDKIKFEKEDFEFCRDFIIEIALILQEAGSKF
ncbi:hypothetical protein KAR91_42940, partial [Candidatus Pacearchaeota archaeon]|nr:hypothetical protein [Candidatus Pacearchaeota archaeon]